MATYTWMFVEGLHLHNVIIFTYSLEKVKILHYAAIGWSKTIYYYSYFHVEKIGEKEINISTFADIRLRRYLALIDGNIP